MADATERYGQVTCRRPFGDFVAIVHRRFQVGSDFRLGTTAVLARYDIDSSQPKWTRSIGLAEESARHFATANASHRLSVVDRLSFGWPNLARRICAMPVLPEEMRRVAFSPDGQLATYRPDGGTIRFWNVHEKQIAPIALPHAGLADMDWHADGRLVSVGSDGWLQICQLRHHPAVNWLCLRCFHS